MREPEDWIPREWLGSETSVEEIESEFQDANERWRTEWREFISKMPPGDYLRNFFSSPETGSVWQDALATQSCAGTK